MANTKRYQAEARHEIHNINNIVCDDIRQAAYKVGEGLDSLAEALGRGITEVYDRGDYPHVLLKQLELVESLQAIEAELVLKAVL